MIVTAGYSAKFIVLNWI